jgi:hypothetical protein
LTEASPGLRLAELEQREVAARTLARKAMAEWNRCRDELAEERRWLKAVAGHLEAASAVDMALHEPPQTAPPVEWRLR